MKFANYDTEGFFDEMFTADNAPREHVRALFDRIEALPKGELRRKHQMAERALMRLGITFNVYGDDEGSERIFPFDIIPRIVSAEEWDRWSAACGSASGRWASTRRAASGATSPAPTWCATATADLRARGQPALPLRRLLRAREPARDEAHLPAGLRRAWPCGRSATTRPLLDTLLAPAPPGVAPRSRGAHAGRLQLGLLRALVPRAADGRELVEGRDLVVRDGFVWMRTTRGFERVDVIYRRIDDDFLDPRSSARLDARRAGPHGGLPAGRVALANAPGTGVADDKVIYAYVPEMIRYYLGEDPILPNVPTYLCWREKTAATCSRTSTSWS
jgi:hypothetical protein